MMCEVMFMVLITGLYLSCSFIDSGLTGYLTYVCVCGTVLLVNKWGFMEELSSVFMADKISLCLVILSVWVSLLMIYSSYKVMKLNNNYLVYSFLIIGLMFVLIISFLVSDLIYFYFFFEVSLIPTLMIIIGWGYQPERLQAGVYFLFYTLTASLPLLIVLLLSWKMFMGVGLYTLNIFTISISGFMAGLLCVMGVMAFMVKLPMYWFHLWLPKAHVEAPVAGSMILAGVLLKLGGYGLIRMSPFIKQYLIKVSVYFWGLSLVGMVYIGAICCRVNDFKALVAYSSVSHMGMVISGLVSLNIWGIIGGLVMMVSHGISSSGLFCVVNMYYERLNSRSFYVNKGLLMILPLFSLLIFMLAAANIAAPPTLNLFSEIMLMGSILKYDYFMLLVFPIGSFLGAVFTLFMFSYSQHGVVYYYLYSGGIQLIRELHTLALHAIPINLLVFSALFFF